MSIKVTSWIWEHSEQKGAKLLMLLALADWCDDEGSCFPGHTRLARKAHISISSVAKHLKTLEEIGELVVIVHGGIDTKAGRTNRYYLKQYRDSLQLVTPLPNRENYKQHDGKLGNEKHEALKLTPEETLKLTPYTSVDTPDTTSSKSEEVTARGEIPVLDVGKSCDAQQSHIGALCEVPPGYRELTCHNCGEKLNGGDECKVVGDRLGYEVECPKCAALPLEDIDTTKLMTQPSMTLCEVPPVEESQPDSNCAVCQGNYEESWYNEDWANNHYIQICSNCDDWLHELSPQPQPEKKPRTPAQLANDARYEARVALLEAVFDAMGRVRPKKIDTPKNLKLAAVLVDLEATPELMTQYYSWLEKHYTHNEYDLTFNSMFKDENWQKFYAKHRDYLSIPLSPNVGEEPADTPNDSEDEDHVMIELTPEELEFEQQVKDKLFGKGLFDG